MKNNAATAMLHFGDGVLRVIRGVVFVPDIAFSLTAKKLTFTILRPEYLLPYLWGVSHMPFGKHQMCLLIVFFKQCLFSGYCSVKPSSVECTA